MMKLNRTDYQSYIDEFGNTDDAWNNYINESMLDDVAEQNQRWLTAIAISAEAMESIIDKYRDLTNYNGLG